MGVNFDEIDRNLRRVIENADNQGEFLQHFLGDPAGDVTFRNISPDGKSIIRKMPNLAKYTGQVAATIRNEMYQTVYIDQSFGDDANTGAENAPFATLRRAFAVAPNAATLKIVHRGDITIDANTEHVDVSNRRVAIVPHDDSPDATLTCITSADRSAITIARGGSIYIGNKVRVNGASDHKNPIWILESGALICSGGMDLDGKSLAWIRGGSIRLDDSAITAQNTSTIFGCGSGWVTVSIDKRATINGDAVTDVLGDWIGGVVYDADSGNPVNVLANINISQ